MTMSDKKTVDCITEAKKIAKQLNDLLHDDALHHLQLFQEYSNDRQAKWSPNLYHRCQLVEALCRKLNNIDLSSKHPNGGNKFPDLSQFSTQDQGI